MTRPMALLAQIAGRLEHARDQAARAAALERAAPVATTLRARADGLTDALSIVRTVARAHLGPTFANRLPI